MVENSKFEMSNGKKDTNALDTNWEDKDEINNTGGNPTTGVYISTDNSEKGKDIDPWKLPELEDDGVPWKDLTTQGKIQRMLISIGKGIAIVLLLYFFVCSLDFLSSALRLMAGKNASGVLANNKFLQNPVVGLMSGVLATVIVQSSSTSTSVLITMVGANLIDIKTSIPIIMGANIGTSVTNTFVSFSQATDRNCFRRAFAAATVHDWFNWLTVIVLLPIESLTGYLEYASSSIVELADWEQNKKLNKAFLSVITKPFTNLIVQIDKKVLEGIAVNSSMYADVPLLKDCKDKCGYLMQYLGLSDFYIGLILFFIAFVLLISCLLFIVKVLNSVLKGRIAVIIKNVLNAEPRFPFNYLLGYLAIVVGCGITILVQSSSIFTSALTPLAGLGVISIERMYPLTLGSNIGTTTTGILAAFAADPQRIRYTLQIAFCHLLFNVTGIAMFFPIPFLRFPVPLAKQLGNICAKYRWFSLLYLLIMFIILPIFVFLLSYGGSVVFMAIGIPLIAFFLLIIIINVMQRKCPQFLPTFIRNWNWLPECLHSLDPLDRQVEKLNVLCRCCHSQDDASENKLFSVDHDSKDSILDSKCPVEEMMEINGTRNFGFVPDSKQENTKL